MISRRGLRKTIISRLSHFKQLLLLLRLLIEKKKRRRQTSGEKLNKYLFHSQILKLFAVPMMFRFPNRFFSSATTIFTLTFHDGSLFTVSFSDEEFEHREKLRLHFYWISPFYLLNFYERLARDTFLNFSSCKFAPRRIWHAEFALTLARSLLTFIEIEGRNMEHSRPLFFSTSSERALWRRRCIHAMSHKSSLESTHNFETPKRRRRR